MRTFLATVRRSVASVAWVWLLLLAGLAIPAAQVKSPPAPQDQQRKTSTPYSGDLSIFDYPDREQKLHVNQVMDALAIAPGKNVADIGAGAGWFTVRAARRVMETGRVYAVEINPEAIRHIEERAQQEKLVNIKTVLGAEDDPRLPPGSVNSVLMLKTYHEIAKPVAL